MVKQRMGMFAFRLELGDRYSSGIGRTVEGDYAGRIGVGDRTSDRGGRRRRGRRFFREGIILEIRRSPLDFRTATVYYDSRREGKAFETRTER